MTPADPVDILNIPGSSGNSATAGDAAADTEYRQSHRQLCVSVGVSHTNCLTTECHDHLSTIGCSNASMCTPYFVGEGNLVLFKRRDLARLADSCFSGKIDLSRC